MRRRRFFRMLTLTLLLFCLGAWLVRVAFLRVTVERFDVQWGSSRAVVEVKRSKWASWLDMPHLGPLIGGWESYSTTVWQGTSRIAWFETAEMPVAIWSNGGTVHMIGNYGPRWSYWTFVSAPHEQRIGYLDFPDPPEWNLVDPEEAVDWADSFRNRPNVLAR
jgi:hypothetical protein